MPDELWNEVRDIVQETGIKTIPRENKCKKAKWLSGEALQIAEERRDAKGKIILIVWYWHKNSYISVEKNIDEESDPHS